MGLNLTRKNQKLYFKIFISLTLCIVLTILILSTVLYMNFESIALEQVYSSSMNSLLQTSKGVSIMTNTAMTLSNQIYSDLNVAKLLYYPDPEITDIRSAVDQLTNYRLSLPFIDSVYVYNGKNETFYINAVSNRNTTRETIQKKDKFDDKYITEVLGSFDNYKQYIPIPRNFIINAEEGIQKHYYTFFRYDVFSGDQLDSAVIVNISEEWIHEVISSSSWDKGSETFIINEKGVLVSNSGRYAMGTDISGNSFIRNIIGSSSSSGCFVDNVNGEKALVTYSKYDPPEWVYIRATPWKIIFAGIERMKIYTVLIGAGILVLGLLISIFISKRLYVPIERILSSLKSLEAEKRENAGILKNGLLREIILGRELNSREAIRQKFQRVNIRLNPDGEFCIVLLKIDNYESFYREYSSEDRGLFRFAIINICLDIFSAEYNTEIVDMGKDCIVIIMNMNDSDSLNYSLPVSGLVKNVREAVLRHLNLSVSATISTVGSSVESLNHLYNQAAEASLHRMFYGHGCIIYCEKIMGFKTREYNYPFRKEKLLIDALMAGETEDAKRLYYEIVSDTAEYMINVFNLTISRLVFTISNVISVIKKNNLISNDIDVNISVLAISNAETIEEINTQFYNLFEVISRKLKERKNSKHEELIVRIHDCIDKEYANPGLSIESIAETLKMSPTHICRLYKQYTMRTILDRVIEVRMKKARELLLKTDYSVSEIAKKTGFTNSSYFYKVFKKENGATPNDFRRNQHNMPLGG